MKLDEYARYDGLGLADLVRRGEISSSELAEVALSAIAKVNSKVNAVIETYDDFNKNLAPDNKNNASFHGVPFLLKDIGSHDAGVTFELGSRLAKGMVSPVRSSLISRFRESGVTILGRTNIPEFGSSCTTEPVLYGPTRNPWDLQKTSGGSSGGAAAAVAAGMVPIAHANDAGGSIRWPAACCGLFGLKPSRNLNPVGPDTGLALHGLAAEHIVSKTVRDSAAMLDVTAGPDRGASYYTPRFPGSYLQQTMTSPGKLRIAVHLTPIFPPTKLQAEVVDAARRTAKLCESLGHEVEECDFVFDHEPILKAFSMIWSSDLRFGLEGLSQIMGRPVDETTVEPHILAAYRDTEKMTASQFMWALQQMNVVARAYGEFFKKYDVILTPAGAQEPFDLGKIGAIGTATFDGWFMKMAAHCPFLSTVNIAGIPAMSVPLEMSPSGLPLGSHFIGPLGSEAMLLSLAAQLETAKPWISRMPATHVSNI